MTKLKYLLGSRKFWAAVGAVCAAVTAALTGEMAWSQAVTLIVAALSSYAVGTGLDNGAPVFNSNTNVNNPPGTISEVRE